jgi:transposase, IS6 family
MDVLRARLRQADTVKSHATEPAGTIQEATFEIEIIILCIRRYLRFALSYRNVEELMAERNATCTWITSPSGAGSSTAIAGQVAFIAGSST